MQNKYNVLVVEDIKIAQRMAELIFQQLGCRVYVADDAINAIALFNRNKYDLVLTDLGLPDLDGITLVEVMRKIESPTKRTPILALTAHDDETFKKKGKEIGVDGYFLKPISTYMARNIIDKYLLGLDC